jgi:hypothetical protein
MGKLPSYSFIYMSLITVIRAKEAVRILLKKLQSKHVPIQLRTITLMNAFFDNCGSKYHVAISNQKFIKALVKALSRYNIDKQVELELLKSIKYWAKVLESNPGMSEIPTFYAHIQKTGKFNYCSLME